MICPYCGCTSGEIPVQHEATCREVPDFVKRQAEKLLEYRPAEFYRPPAPAVRGRAQPAPEPAPEDRPGRPETADPQGPRGISQGPQDPAPKGRPQARRRPPATPPRATAEQAAGGARESAPPAAEDDDVPLPD